MKTNYIFIDFENIQRHDVGLLKGHPSKVFLFVGANQSKISFDLVASIQKLGDQAKYIKIEGTGHNALDFHIAFYVGRMTERDPEGIFFIVSKDTGFDPLIRYLKENGISAQRITDLKTIATENVSENNSRDEKINAIVKNLHHRGQSRPRNIKTLHNVISALFMKKLDEKNLDELIEQLKNLGIITVSLQGKVSYKLPDDN
jgi:hypothetical protein